MVCVCDFVSRERCGHSNEASGCAINHPESGETMTSVIYRLGQLWFPQSCSLIHSYSSEERKVKESTVWVVGSLPRNAQQSSSPYRKADIYAFQWMHVFMATGNRSELGEVSQPKVIFPWPGKTNLTYWSGQLENCQQFMAQWAPRM